MVSRLARLGRRILASQSIGGLLVGMIFVALSLTPSLLPRDFIVQGILSGCVFAAGYGIGVFAEWLWRYLELDFPNPKLARGVRLFALVGCTILVVVALWLSTGWQNATRLLMGIAPVETQQPVWVAAIAVIPALLLIGIGTLIVHGVRLVARWLGRIIPRRVALILGMVIVGVVTTVFVNGVVVRWVLYTADRFYANLDALAGQYADEPTVPEHSGSAQSLVDWDTIGQDARVYVQSGPTADEIANITGKPAETPLRTYVGLRSAETAEARAELALAEMLRIGAFDRSVLVLIMPVGTGWIDPAAIDTLEFLHGGDVASVAVQYSYLTSWLSLLAEPEVGTETAQVLFSTIYDHWTKLPRETRPKLYLHGLSLGAYASQASASIYNILADPYQGALWVGPPFASTIWRGATADRQPGSPAWLPRFENGSIIRFSNQNGDLADAPAPWGPLRVVYLQYPSDPIVFFEPAMLYRRPAWLEGPRAPDVSPQLNWYPVVTFLQLALDMALSQTSPIGFGHVYAPQDYLDGWVAVTDAPGWTSDELAELRRKVSRSGDISGILGGWFRR